jgi:integrase
MHNEPPQKPGDPRQTPWNKGKLIGSKPPLRTKNVWSIRTKLRVEKRIRDFNLDIDSKLHGCDVVSLRVEDVAPHGMTVDRVTVRQRKTGHPVHFELSEQTREAVDDYIRSAPRRAREFLFPSRRHTDRCLTTRQYSRLVLGGPPDSIEIRPFTHRSQRAENAGYRRSCHHQLRPSSIRIEERLEASPLSVYRAAVSCAAPVDRC